MLTKSVDTKFIVATKKRYLGLTVIPCMAVISYVFPIIFCINPNPKIVVLNSFFTVNLMIRTSEF